MRQVARIGLVLLAAALAAASLVPAIPTEWWAVRLLDFPRLYFAAALAAVCLGLIPFLRTAPKLVGTALAWALWALAVDVWILLPYLPSGTAPPAACPMERQLSVLVANVQLGNRNARPLIETVRRVEPDLLLAMETDAWWDEALSSLHASMPYGLQRITGSYYGIHLLSRLQLVDGEVRHLAGRDTPSVVTGVTLRIGEVVGFVGMHPKPPQVWQSARGRDDELYAAAEVLGGRAGPGILAGDLNATPWGIAVEGMRRMAGLIDPRVGYGYVATWNAKSWMRWPLDHVFHSGGFATVSIERLDAFGSDHFPYLVRLCRDAVDGGKPSPRSRAGNVDVDSTMRATAGTAERLREHRIRSPD